MTEGKNDLVQRLQAIADQPWFSGGSIEKTAREAAEVIADLLEALEVIVRESDKLPEDQFQAAVAAIAKTRGQSHD